MKYIYGIDIGGTAVKFGRFDENGKLISKWELPMDSGKYADRLAPYIAGSILVDLDKNCLSQEDIIGIGMGCPGVVDSNQIIHGADNLKLDGISVVNSMSRFVNIKMHMENDANTAALGEYYFGSGKSFDSIAFITLGTGVGCGIIINNNLIKGSDFSAGELGHICVDFEEENICSCGLKGCLEQYCSARGITRLSGGYTPIEIFTALQYIEDTMEPLKSTAIDVYRVFSQKMARACANISSIINPGAFIFGGGISNAGNIVIKKTIEEYQKIVYKRAVNTPFLISELKNDAGIYGAMSFYLKQ